MKPSSCLLAAILCSAGTLTAAEGVSTAWTEVSAADQNLMGDYQGEWLDAPRGHYFNINKPLAAQVTWNLLENGVLIHANQVIPHGTTHAFASRSAETKGDGPIKLQDHGNAIQFRNIWVIPAK